MNITSERIQVGDKVTTPYNVVGVVTEVAGKTNESIGVTFPVAIELAPGYLVDFLYLSESELDKF